MAKLYKFDNAKVTLALAAARSSFGQLDEMKITSEDALPSVTSLMLTADCISVKVEDGEICLELPFGFGNVCLPLPIDPPNGTVGEACLKICTTFGIPTGIKVTVTIGGSVVVEQSFGVC